MSAGKVLAAILCAAALTSCNGNAEPPATSGPSPAVSTPAESPTPSPSPEPSPTTAGATGCSNEVETLAHPKGRGLKGDLDGDGAPEMIALAVDESGTSGCQAFVSVESTTVHGAVAIDEPQISFDLGLPALDSTTPIGFGPGDEVVIVVTAGASTQFFALVTVVEGAPVQVTLKDGPYGNLFPYGGSVGHLEASDCGVPAEGQFGVPLLVVSSATAIGDDYRVERVFFTSEDPELRPESDLTEKKTVTFEELVSYPEFGEAPFAHCN